jgi:hypothetical protein
MADLVIGVVMNILRHVAVEQLQGLRVRHIPSKRLGVRPAPKTVAPTANIPPFKNLRLFLALKD